MTCNQAVTCILADRTVSVSESRSIPQADRSVLTAQLNLHARDLRVLDPMLTQMNACAILCRERAILINLEHLKCIVTTSYVLILNVENKAVLSFLDELQKKLRQQVRRQITPLRALRSAGAAAEVTPARARCGRLSSSRDQNPRAGARMQLTAAGCPLVTQPLSCAVRGAGQR